MANPNQPATTQQNPGTGGTADAQAGATLTLKITFTGLFTFVPNGNELVVLLPRTGVLSNNNRVHQHHAYLIVDREYLPNEQQPRHPQNHPDCDKAPRAGETLDAEESNEHSGRSDDHAQHNACDHAMHTHECIPLGRYRTSFTNAASGEEVIPPAEAVNLTPLAGTLDPRQVSPTPLDTVWAQIVLPGTRHPIEPGGKAKWKLDKDEPDMTHVIMWTTDVAADFVEIKFAYLGGGAAGTLRLRPKNGGSVINLNIDHLPPKHDRHKGKKCCDAPHFMAYYELFGSAAEWPLPILKDDPGQRVDDKFTCMTSQARTSA